MFKLTLSFKGRLLKVYYLKEGDNLIGRDPQCGVHIDSLAIQPQHARIQVQNGEAVLHDLSDGGGVLVNGQQVSSRPLQDGDEIQIGKHTLTLAPADTGAVMAAPEPESHPADDAPPRIGWLQVLSGPHLGRAFPVERERHSIGKPGAAHALITTHGTGYHIVHQSGAPVTRVDGVELPPEGLQLNDGAIIECGELRVQFFMDQAVSVPAIHKPAATGAELRHFSRVPFDAHVRLRRDGAEWSSRLLDVSLKGALVALPADWAGATIGDAYRLELLLDDNETVIRMDVTVAHIKPDRIGLRCEHIDIDSITHLRRLIELNLGDPELLERELEAM